MPFQPPETLQRLACDLAAGGGRDALISFGADEPETRDFSELFRRVEGRAHDLVKRGIGANDPVVVCGSDSLGWIVAFLAVARCGACAVPVDAQFSTKAFAHVLENSGASLVLAGSSAAERFADACSDAGIDMADLEVNEADDGTSTIGANDDFAETGPDDRAILFYTSGTTGRPKGVPLTHANIMSQVEVLSGFELVAQGDRILLPLPLHHVYPLVVGILTPLALRLTVILPGGFTGAEILEGSRRGGATVMIGVPRLYEALLDGIEERISRRGRLASMAFCAVKCGLRTLRRRLGWNIGKVVLFPLHRRVGPELKTLVAGGAALNSEIAWSLEGLGWQVATGYGLTETSPLVTVKPPGEGRFETAGRPVRDVELRIDESAGEDEEHGEVLARGPGVFAGYHRLPEKTEAAFTEDGWFRTGDLGRIGEDGHLRLAGRKSTLIVTESGENVQPDEIESAYEAHPAISEIAVLESDGGLAALVVPDPSTSRSDAPEAAIREAIREVSQDLPSYQLLTEFRITGEAIPRTRLGKPRRHLIEERYRRAQEENEDKSAEDGVRAGPVAPESLSDEDRALLDDDGARAAFELLGELFTGPIRRAFARAARVLAVDPKGAAASSLAYGAAVLKRDEGLVWFPEGRRTTDGDLQPFRPGIGMVLEHWPASVVPVVIRGTFSAWPRSRRMPRIRPVSVEFLPPVESTALAEEGEGESPAERIVDALRARIANARDAKG